jgi:hypothetical protein
LAAQAHVEQTHENKPERISSVAAAAKLASAAVDAVGNDARQPNSMLQMTILPKVASAGVLEPLVGCDHTGLTDPHST